MLTESGKKHNNNNNNNKHSFWLKVLKGLGVVAHALIPSTEEAEGGISL